MTIPNPRVVTGVLADLSVRAVSRRLYGNDAGIRNNRRGQRLLALPTAPDQPVARRMHKEGLAFLSGDYDPAMLRGIADAFATLVEDPQHSEATFAAEVPGNEAPARTISDPLAVIPEIRRLVSPPIREAVKAYYGSEFRVVEVGAWRNYHIDNPMIDAYSNFWHFDRLNTAHLRLFVNFTDGISRDSGAFRVHPVESSGEIVRCGYILRNIVVGRAQRLIEDPARYQVLEGDIGAAALVTTSRCLHRAGIPPAGKHRDIVSITVFPDDEALPEEWCERPL